MPPVTLESLKAKAAEVKGKILQLQKDRAAAGMTADQEAEVDKLFDDLSVTADPTVQNPPGTEPDPNLRT